MGNGWLKDPIRATSLKIAVLRGWPQEGRWGKARGFPRWECVDNAFGQALRAHQEFTQIWPINQINNHKPSITQKAQTRADKALRRRCGLGGGKFLAVI